MGRKLCHGKNNSEGHSPKRLSTERQRCNKKIGTPRWLSGKEFACQCERCGFSPWVRKIPWRRKWQPTPVFLPGKSHGQRRLTGYSSWGCKRVEHDLETKQQTQSEDYRKHPFPDTLPSHQQGSRKKEDHSSKTSNTGLLSKEDQLGKPKVKRKNRNKDSKGIWNL